MRSGIRQLQTARRRRGRYISCAAMLNRLFGRSLSPPLCWRPAALSAQTRRALTLDDHSRIVSVGDPQRSPDGLWVAYTVTTIDAEKDRRNTDVWMVKWDGSEQLQLTSSPDSECSPRWSPDNKYLAFVSSRGTEEEKQTRRPDLAAQSRRRRSAARQRLQGRRVRHPVVARQHAHRVRGRGSGSGRGAREARGLEAQDRAADRDRSLSLQAGSRRLSEAPLQPHRHLHRRHEGGEGDHQGQHRRSEPVVVAGRQADRVPEQARPRRSGSHVERGSVGGRSARGRGAAADYEDAGRRRRTAGVESRRQPAGRGDRRHRSLRAVLDEQADRRAVESAGLGGAGDQAADLHAVARSRGVQRRLVGGRAAHLVPAAGRSHQSPRHRAGGEPERHAAASHHRQPRDQHRRARARTATSRCSPPSRRA